jgi:hypothetical protein
MQVYIEVVVLDNFFMTMLVCLIAVRLQTLRTRWLATIIVCSIGTLVAVLLPLVVLEWYVALLLKSALGVLSGYTLSIGRAYKARCIAIFFVATAILGGAVWGINMGVQGNVYSALTRLVSPLPIGVLAMIGLAVYVLLLKFLSSMHRRIHEWQLEAEVVVCGVSVRVRGLIDSGNRIKYKGRGVAVIEQSVLQAALGIQWQSLRWQHITINTVAGQSSMPITQSDKIVLYSTTGTHILYDVAIGLSNQRLGVGVILPEDLA